MTSNDLNPYILKSTAHYTQWREYVATSLRARGLWNFAFDDVKEPTALKDETAVHLFNRIEEYHQKRQQTAGYIGLCLGPHFRSMVKGKEDDPRAIMRHLDKELRPKTNATRMDLLRNFVSIRRKPDEEIEVFFARIEAAQAELEECGMVANPAYQLLAILDGLPPEYDAVRAVIESEDKIDVDRAKRLIRQQDGVFASRSQLTAVNAVGQTRGKPNANRRRDRKPKPTSDNRRRSRDGRQRYDDQREQRRSDRQGEVVCYYCHEPGHVRPDCPKRHAAKRAGSRANAATEETSSEDETVLSVTDQVNTVSDETDCWYLDSGATRHVTCRRDLLHDFVERKDNTRGLLLGNNHRCPVLGHGTLRATITIDGETRRVVLQRVLYAPELAKNLVSTALIARNGHQIQIDRNGCRVRAANGKVILQARLDGNMLRLPIHPIPPPPPVQALATTKCAIDVNELHRRLGHARESRLRAILKEQGIKWPATGLAECVVCLRGKAARKPILNKPVPRSDTPMEQVHSDVCGPMSVCTRDGKRYFVSFVDDHSRYATIYLLRAKSEVKDALRHYLRSAPSGRRCRFLHTDQGGEYKNDSVAKLLLKHGVTHETASSHTPEHNGVAERFNRTILDMVRCMLLDSSLPKNLWGEAAITAVAINNRLPTRANDDVPPIVKWDSSLNHSIAHLHHFGAPVQVLIPSDDRSKLDARTREGHYLGPARENATHHRILVNGRIIETRNVTIRHGINDITAPLDKHAELQVEQAETEESPTTDPINLVPALPPRTRTLFDVTPPASPPTTPPASPPTTPPASPPTTPPASPSTTPPASPSTTPPASPPTTPPATPPTTPPASPVEVLDNKEQDYVETERTTTIRHRRPWPSPKKPPSRRRQPNRAIFNKDFRALVVTELNAPITTPTSYKEAINSPEAEEWIQAMTEEFDAIIRNATFTLERLPKGRKAIGARWLFKLKRKADGSIDRFKARWVAKGYSQLPGVDFDETFAPVIRLENLRLLLAIAAALNLEVHQMDVDNAFLNANLSEEIYVQQPEGFEDQDHPDYVCRLRKSLYGLKQAPLEWNRTIDTYLKKHDFRPTRLDPCIYVRAHDDKPVFIAIYVDDCTIIAPSDQIDDVKALLREGFRMKDLGEAKSVLGLEVLRDRASGAVYLRQAGKIHELVHDFGLAKAKPIYTPMELNLQLPKIEQTNDDDVKLPYRSAVGRLSYIALATRPDIAFAVNSLSRHVNAFGRQHWKAAKRVIRYLKTTLKLAIRYNRSGRDDTDDHPLGFADADWGGDHHTRKSTTGLVFVCSGGPIRWGSRTQKCIATSTTEAELNALAEAMKEAIHLRDLYGELLPTHDYPITLHSDNQGALTIANSKPGEHVQRSKHYAIKVAFLRDQVDRHGAHLLYEPTATMPADLLTKALSRNRTESLCHTLNLVRPPSSLMGRVA